MVAPMADGHDPRTAGRRIEQLFVQLEGIADPRARATTEELVRAVTELYGAGLARAVQLASAECPGLVDRMAGDEVLGGLLTVHGLRPDGLERRLAEALESVRPFLAQHDGDVELLDVDEEAGAVLLRLLGSCDGCPSSAVTLRQSVERAIFDAAPEITIVDVDGPSGAEPDPATGAVPITLGRKPQYDSCPTEVTVS